MTETTCYNYTHWKKGSVRFMKKRPIEESRRSEADSVHPTAKGSKWLYIRIHRSWQLKKLFCKYVGYKIINPFNIDADLHSITHLTSHHCIKSLIAINPFDIDADLHSITHLTSHYCIKSLIAINPFDIDADLHSITHLTSHHCFKSLIASNPTYPSSTFILLLKCLSNLSLLSRKNAKISTWPRTVQCYPIPTLILPHVSVA